MRPLLERLALVAQAYAGELNPGGAGACHLISALVADHLAEARGIDCKVVGGTYKGFVHYWIETGPGGWLVDCTRGQFDNGPLVVSELGSLWSIDPNMATYPLDDLGLLGPLDELVVFFCELRSDDEQEESARQWLCRFSAALEAA